MALKAVDFFCGIGGVTRGFLKAGIDVIAGIDIDADCKETYEANHKRINGESAKFFAEDILDFDINKIKNLLNRNDKLVVIGCAPCQPFTKITKNLQGRTKERGLLQAFADVIRELNPEYIFLENVQGLNAPENKEILDSFINSLKPEFDLTPQIVNASHYGVPQSRKRMILFGKKNSHINFPEITHGKGKGQKKIKTLEDVIKTLPKLKMGVQHDTLKEHVCAELEDISMKRLSYQTSPGDGMEKWPKSLQLPSRRDREYNGHNDVYARLRWDKPCGTLTTKFVSISNGRFAHPEQDRGLSILEGLIIQTFGTDFKMKSTSLRIKAKQIGNAVPVKLARAFARQIINSENNPNSTTPKKPKQATLELV
jgi:DNA (cytosine-5)-methyltransferase 1